MQNDIQVFQTTPIEAITRSECDIQISTAKRYPRDRNKALDNAIDCATLSIKTAKDALYFRPVGKKNNKMKYHSDISIRGAEALYTNWGNLRIASTIIGETDGVITVRGMCHDLESNIIISKESHKAIGKAGENQKAVIMDALSSLAIRKAVESTIPGSYLTVFKDAVFEKIAGSSPEEVKSTFASIVNYFNSIQYSEQDVLGLVDIGSRNEITAENVAYLVGLINAIKDEITTAFEAFGYEGTMVIAKEIPKDNKPNTSTPGQRFATLQLQLSKKKGGGEMLGKAIDSFVEKFALSIEEFSPEQFTELNNVLEAELKNAK